MEIRIRELIAELFKNPYIVVTYNEIEDGGFELIVRVKKEDILKQERYVK